MLNQRSRKNRIIIACVISIIIAIITSLLVAIHADQTSGPAEIFRTTIYMTTISALCIVYITRMLVVENNKLNEIAYIDNVTTLYNRAYMEKVFDSVEEKQDPCHVFFIMFDLNGLKQTNDQLGHAAGDELLKTFSLLLKDIFEKDGICIRMGGDEFAVIIFKKAYRTRQACHKLRDECAIKHISFSYGFVEEEWDYKNINFRDKIYYGADELMYIKKQEYYKNKLEEATDGDKSGLIYISELTPGTNVVFHVPGYDQETDISATVVEYPLSNYIDNKTACIIKPKKYYDFEKLANSEQEIVMFAYIGSEIAKFKSLYIDEAEIFGMFNICSTAKGVKYNRRNEKRMQLGVDAIINIDNEEYCALLRDISLTGIGMYTNIGTPIRINDTITIEYADESRKHTIKERAQVVRVTEIDKTTKSVGCKIL